VNLAVAQYELAQMYAKTLAKEGKLSLEDLAQALTLYQKAAMQGNPDALKVCRNTYSRRPFRREVYERNDHAMMGRAPRTPGKSSADRVLNSLKEVSAQSRKFLFRPK
jgi:TPR repeat protein